MLYSPVRDALNAPHAQQVFRERQNSLRQLAD
jgi:hypothetical protein